MTSGEKNFLLFTGDWYEPGMGWNDFKGDFASLEEAVAAGKCYPCDRAHVVSLKERKIVTQNDHYVNEPQDPLWADEGEK